MSTATGWTVAARVAWERQVKLGAGAGVCAKAAFEAAKANGSAAAVCSTVRRSVIDI